MRSGLGGTHMDMDMDMDMDMEHEGGRGGGIVEPGGSPTMHSPHRDQLGCTIGIKGWVKSHGYAI